MEPSPEPTRASSSTTAFATYKDNLVGPHSEDEKHWHKANITNKNQAEVVTSIRAITKALAAAAGAKVGEIMADERGAQGIAEEMAKRPYYHMTATSEGNA